MSRQKLKKFEENKSRHNLIETGKPFYETCKGKWNEEYFNNNNEISLELACGRGEYTVGQARLFPERNFVGVDLKGDRLWKGSGVAIEENLNNTAFLRAQIQQLDEFFAPGEVNEIWIMFPDPRPRKREAKLRLTNPRFLDAYKRIVGTEGVVRLKTDNTGFFEYTLEVLQERNDITNFQHTFDLYESDLRPECYDIKTRYEEKFSAEGHKIKYLRFRFN